MFEQAFKNIDDVLWKEAGCTTELDYTEQTSWLLFLKYLSVKNPNGGEAVVHRSPEEIMDEIAALDAESSEVLRSIRRLL
jgi:hypothetical protein